MKSIMKYASLLLVMFVLAGCSNQGKQEATTEEASTQATTVEGKKDDKAKETDKAKDDEETTEEGSDKDKESTEADEESSEEPAEDAVTFKFFVNGTEQSELAFTVEDAEGMSVLEAMESNKDFNFNFNEEEGVVDMINDIQNNYGSWETWAYLYNGQFAELGVVSQTLSPGDTIEWYYGTTDMIPVNILPAQY